jgi:hypothetical protein
MSLGVEALLLSRWWLAWTWPAEGLCDSGEALPVVGASVVPGAVRRSDQSACPLAAKAGTAGYSAFRRMLLSTSRCYR